MERLHDEAFEYYTHNDSMYVLQQKLDEGPREIDEEELARQLAAQRQKRAAKFLDEAGPLTDELVADLKAYYELRNEYERVYKLFAQAQTGALVKKQNILQYKGRQLYAEADELKMELDKTENVVKSHTLTLQQIETKLQRRHDSFHLATAMMKNVTDRLKEMLETDNYKMMGILNVIKTNLTQVGTVMSACSLAAVLCLLCSLLLPASSLMPISLHCTPCTCAGLSRPAGHSRRRLPIEDQSGRTGILPRGTSEALHCEDG
jgi:hypothetical protein